MYVSVVLSILSVVLLTGCSLSAGIDSMLSSVTSNQLKITFPDAPLESQISANTFVVNANSAQEIITISCPSGVTTVAITAPASAVGTFNCIGGEAQIPFDTTLLPEGASSITVEAPSNAAIAPVTGAIHKDSIPPTGDLDVGVATYANKYSQTNFAMTGNCSDVGGRVIISATSQSDSSKVVKKSLDCDSNNHYSSSLNLNALPEGGFTAAVKHYDLAGNSVSDSLIRQKDITDAAVPILSVVPAAKNSLTNLTTTVSGADVVGYRYKLGLQSTTICSLDSGYTSSTIVIATAITEDLSSFGNASLRLCVLSVDIAGNILNTANALNVDWVRDTVAPSVVITSSTGATTNLNSIPVTVTFSESVTGFTVGDITVTNASISGFTGSGTTYTFDVTPTTDGVLSVAIASGVAQDDAGNNNTAAVDLTRTVDRDRPSVVISSSTSSPTNATTFPVTVTFSQTVTGFDSADVVIDNGSLSNFSGSGTTYTFDVTKSGSVTQGYINVRVAADVAQDAGGNFNTAATTLAMYYDSIVPTVSLTAMSSANTAISPVVFEASFSKSITGFTDSDLNVVNGIASISGTGPYSISVVPTGSGTVSVQVKANSVQDTAGNYNIAASSVVGVMYDAIQPSAPTVTNATYTTSSSSAPSASWSGAADGHSGIASYDIAIGTTAGASDVKTFTNVGTATSYTVSGLTLSVGATYYVSIRVNDNAGNQSTTVSGSAFRYLTNPTLSSVSPTSGAPTGGTTITLTGTGFYGSISVTVDGNPCSSVSVSSSTSLTCITPAGTAGAKNIVVSNTASQTATLASSFTYVASSSTQEFLFTGSDQSFVIPAGVSSIQIKAWGAGGTVTNGTPEGTLGQGGAGAFAGGTLAVTPGETLTVIVGGHGGYGGGDGAGGGRSAIRRSSTELITAGGGGGGGFSSDSNGGAGGDATSQAPSAVADPLIGADAHGKGATPSAIGALGTVSCNGATEYSPLTAAAAQFLGGKNGGGGGYYGGGGGTGCGDFGGTYLKYAGGGGGSSYLGGVTSGTSTAGSGLITGNANDSARTGSSNPQAGNSSRNGLVIISY